MAYQVIIPKKVQKELNKIDSRYTLRINLALISLAEDPFLGKKLKGDCKDERSYHVWPYRIVYRIKQYELVVLIVKIGHRQGIY
jgi:mRNA interferase RelE/StbE